MSVLTVARKSLLPLIGVLLTLLLVGQMRSGRGPSFALSSTPAEAAPSVPQKIDDRVVAEGRLVAYPGAEVAVATELPGVVVRLLVEEKDHVRKGQVIAELKADDLRAELSESRARIEEAEADIRFAELDLERAERLLAEKVGTQDAAVRARRNRDAASARKETALAASSRLQAVLAKTRIVAPIEGVVILRAVQPGEHVQEGEPLVTIADLDRIRVEAEVDEFDTGRVVLGAPVQVTAEGYTGQSWPARVEEIPDAVVPRRLKPQDPGKPSDTRVLLVKIALDGKTPLKLGQRVEVEISPKG
ncbi:MAG TPA: efflux RND transporter periplasmic adaptor subunit [Thermoanaerobaculia bacterium]|nr:efflux RND transporter periplasmic adaptor subunit [Thermoanaerobaculia bacterium]